MKKHIGLFLFLMISTFGAFANSTIQKDMVITPHPYYTSIKAKAVSLNPTDFMAAALVASGVPDAKVPGYLKQADQIYKDYETYRITKNTKLNDAEAAIVYLYDTKVLIEYEENQTYMDKLFDTGYYNCVSSAILYMYIMKRRGYKVIGNHVTGHVFCSVKDERGKITDVETTNAFGYAPGVVKNVSTSNGNQYQNWVTDNEYDDRVYISGRGLIASIITNTMIYEEHKENPDCDKIIQLAADCAELQKDSKNGLQDMYSHSGNVLYILAQQEKWNEMLYVSKAINDRYGKYGKSKLLTGNTAVAFNNLFQNSDLDGQKDLLKTYGKSLKEEDFNFFYETYTYKKAIQYYNLGEVKKAEDLLMKAISTLGESSMLSSLLNNNSQQ